MTRADTTQRRRCERAALSVPINPALRHADQRRQRLENRIADQITRFAGSMQFVYLHVIWFAAWIILGVEYYPYGLLTMIVSPASGKPLFQAATADLNPWTEAKVDTDNPDRGPLLIISGEKDHTVPLAFVKRFTQGEKEGGSHAY
jgi:hypothetical protein